MLEMNYKALGVKKAMATVQKIPPELQVRTLAVGRRTAMATLQFDSPGGMGRRDSWSSDFNKSKGIVDIFNTKYPMKIIQYMEQGTRPHMILPKKKGGVLRFMSEGKVIFARSVAHPGTRPYKMIEHAARNAALAMREVARRYVPGLS